jgi:CheY-like chemotaxis protein
MTDNLEPMHSALIVDDNNFNREIFRIALAAAGYQSTEASNGVEALAILETRQFDLAVLDLQMPLVGGATVLKNLRFTPHHAKMVVIVATANPHMAVGEVESLADCVLLKPIDIHEFARLVARFRDGLRAAPHEQKRAQ